ncbi:XdhC family protein [Thiohalophilus thiocyanatoxydans]|uniref:Putative sulfurylase large subunit (Molybdopterin cytosine dinucleotide biosynthesis) /predicted sulfurylase small subunit (Molybdopterin cytosine dinucleotide biosynthesis) n=1 Tax=Thiohalophilus thiocyanatoxydans TaxID=381308 RepID=A0A4R8ILH0_9GAMM|nr:XdhC family protein [Thiohalophilus thiocyanatoxydans]TDY01636.1 putative sulfurylase large subunit (molybdopterin cytosine dinucleotide biosynthesis) /predicted sulfurylase small subunit (molybdopterin cytosine dinucleotide biosynthesis) [Thiohalophilus thiocyanatoxydans]
MANWGTDRDVIQTAHQWLQEGHALVLVTVLKTWGSSPRPPGSLLVMRPDGVHVGSVSGGCVEEDLLARYRQNELSDLPVRLDYGVDRQEATRFGLPCGGRLELLLEQLIDPDQLQPLLSAMEQDELVARRVDLTGDAVSLGPASADQAFSYTDEAISKVFGPQWQMLLIGAGHLSQYVSQLALMLDYRVIVCDPREEYAAGWQVPGARLIGMMPDEAVGEYTGHPRSIVLALTHDPKLDDMALLEALGSEAFYVGAIGSQRNCDARRRRLRELGLSRAQIQRLHAPVGLDIGSHTPPEIALAILAEITALRNAATAVVRNPDAVNVV